MKTPDETHPIRLTPAPGVVRVLFEGHEIADSDDVLVLQEASFPPVYYFPRDDVRMAFLRRTDKTTHCPYKGQASYFTIYRDRQVIEDAVWSYETPYPALDAIAGRLAFYPEHVEFQLGDLTPAQTQALDVGEDPPHRQRRWNRAGRALAAQCHHARSGARRTGRESTVPRHCVPLIESAN